MLLVLALLCLLDCSILDEDLYVPKAFLTSKQSRMCRCAYTEANALCTVKMLSQVQERKLWDIQT